MTKLKKNKKRMKEIEAIVDTYIATLEEIKHTPEALMDFFVSGVYKDMDKEERFYAKSYYKTKLPYTEWRETIGKDPDALGEDIIHFQDLQNKGRL